MREHLTPEQVVRTVMRGIADRAWDRLHELYAEDTVVEHLFALPKPTRMEGREALRRHFANIAGVPLRLEVRNMVVHTTPDPEVVVAEWDYDGVVTTTGRSFQVSNVVVARVRAGLIVASRDYHNHAFMAAVLGRAPALFAALTEATKG